MRPVSLVLVFAACGGSGDGAVLSFTAPDGPGAASRIEIVLASADSDAQTAARQRSQPGMLANEDVIYYRQRSTVDAIQGVVALDGFEVRIEPDAASVDDEAFITFALIYDKEDALIAVGTVNDETGAPTPVIVKPGLVAAYDVAVIKLAPDAEAAGIAAGQGRAVSCESRLGAWRSGAVWKPASGPQIRLLLPDVSEDPDATDAMLRASDLDCDGHAADSGDCDDLRTAYHAGQTELCDGDDTDCDGRRMELVQGCSAPTIQACSEPGVQLCAEGPMDEATGAPGTCMPTATCGCALAGGGYPTGCNRCELTSTGVTGGHSPCAPAAGKVTFPVGCDQPGCVVDVVGADGPWEIKIASQVIGPFSQRLTGTTNQIYMRAKYLTTAAVPDGTFTVGGAYLSITPPVGRPILMPISLQLGDAMQCTVLPTGDNSMQCFP